MVIGCLLETGEEIEGEACFVFLNWSLNRRACVVAPHHHRMLWNQKYKMVCISLHRAI